MSTAVSSIEAARTFGEAVTVGRLVELTHVPLGPGQTFASPVAATAAVAAAVLGYPRASSGCAQFARSVELLRACRAAMERCPGACTWTVQCAVWPARGDDLFVPRGMRTTVQCQRRTIGGRPAVLISLADAQEAA